MIYPISFTQLALRISSLIAISFFWYFALWWFAIPCTVLYVWHYQGYELIILGALIDIQFLSGVRVPYYTVSFTLLLLVVHVAKPFVRPRMSTYEIE